MLVLAAFCIGSRDCKTKFGHDRTRKTSLRCRGLQIQGYFYKATPIYEVSSNLSQIRTNFAAYSVNFEKMNAGNHVLYRQWTSLFRCQAILAYSLNLSLRDYAKAHVKILSALWWASPSTWLGFCACYVSVWLINTWDIVFFACRPAYVSLRIT